MSKMYVGSIDLSKIDKTKITEGKNGAKYYDINIWINDKEDQFGNIGSIQERMSKEEREASQKPKYIGNCKDYQGKKPEAKEPQEQGGDLPF